MNKESLDFLKGLQGAAKEAISLCDIALLESAKNADVRFSLSSRTEFNGTDVIIDSLSIVPASRKLNLQGETTYLGEVTSRGIAILNGFEKEHLGKRFYTHAEDLLNMYRRILAIAHPIEEEGLTVSIEGFGDYFSSFKLNGKAPLTYSDTYHSHLEEMKLLKSAMLRR